MFHEEVNNRVMRAPFCNTKIMYLYFLPSAYIMHFKIFKYVSFFKMMLKGHSLRFKTNILLLYLS